MATNSDYDKAYATISAALASNPSVNLFTEPPSPADPDHPPLYPHNQTWDGESGHSIQLDDTPGRERVCIQHGKSKNFIEMHPNGDQVVKVFGENFDVMISSPEYAMRRKAEILQYKQNSAGLSEKTKYSNIRNVNRENG